jgi:hypothetical protein
MICGTIDTKVRKMAFSRQIEERTLEKMMEIYCKDKHRCLLSGCAECSELLSYARERLARCPLGKQKPVCAKCPVHCYKPEMRGRIKTVMRYCGPKMIFISPLLTLHYILKKMFK